MESLEIVFQSPKELALSCCDLWHCSALANLPSALPKKSYKFDIWHVCREMSQGHLRAGDCPPPFLAKIHRTRKHGISTFLLGRMFQTFSNTKVFSETKSPFGRIWSRVTDDFCFLGIDFLQSLWHGISGMCLSSPRSLDAIVLDIHWTVAKFGKMKICLRKFRNSLEEVLLRSCPNLGR